MSSREESFSGCGVIVTLREMEMLACQKLNRRMLGGEVVPAYLIAIEFLLSKLNVKGRQGYFRKHVAVGSIEDPISCSHLDVGDVVIKMFVEGETNYLNIFI